MNRYGEFFFQDLIHRTLTVNAAQAVKGGPDDPYPEVAFAPFPGPGVARVQVAFVDHLQFQWIKGFTEF